MTPRINDRPGDNVVIVNALSVDVEDYFHVSAFSSRIEKRDWSGCEQRLEGSMAKVLGLLDEHGTKATFFVLGWVAKHYPAIVSSIAAAGHEVASHGWAHIRVTAQTPDEFAQDIRLTKKTLQDIIGIEVKGYRAASFSFTEEVNWAFDVLCEEGYRYSSSIYPISHDHYGLPNAPRFAFRTGQRNDFLEIPVTSINAFGRNLPCGGGGYFRLSPYIFSRWALRNVNKQEKMPCMFYFHPWELDPEQPRIRGLTAKTRFRHYLNLSREEGRLRRLLRDFEWDRIDRVHHEKLQNISAAAP